MIMVICPRNHYSLLHVYVGGINILNIRHMPLKSMTLICLWNQYIPHATHIQLEPICLTCHSYAIEINKLHNQSSWSYALGINILYVPLVCRWNQYTKYVSHMPFYSMPLWLICHCNQYNPHWNQYTRYWTCMSFQSIYSTCQLYAIVVNILHVSLIMLIIHYLLVVLVTSLVFI